MMKENRFGNIISKLRNERNLTQKELANILHISDKAISRWETGSNYPDLPMLYKISNYFKIPFHDLLKARLEDEDIKDDSVQKLLSEIDDMKYNHKRKMRKLLFFSICIIIFLIVAMLFINTYNRFRVYNVNLSGDEFYSINGIYVETRIKDTLNLNRIRLKNVNVTDTDIVSVDLYYVENDKEYIIQNYSSLDNINFSNYQSYIKMDDLSKYIDNLYIRVKIIDSKNNTKEYTAKLEFALNFSNNKILYKDDNLENIDLKLDEIKLDIDEIKDILIKNGYKEESDVLKKETKEYSISYLYKVNRVNYTYERNNLNYMYEYNLKYYELKVSVFNENNLEVENYIYDAKEGEIIECNVGSCNDYKEAIRLIKKNFMSLFD